LILLSRLDCLRVFAVQIPAALVGLILQVACLSQTLMMRPHADLNFAHGIVLALLRPKCSRLSPVAKTLGMANVSRAIPPEFRLDFDFQFPHCPKPSRTGPTCQLRAAPRWMAAQLNWKRAEVSAELRASE
jgi:hypothetical protein